MITWKQSLRGFEWLIHQVWYLEIGDNDTIETQPYLIPNPRAHLLITPHEQAYAYRASDELFSGNGSHLISISDKLLLLEDHPPLKRIGITFKPHTANLLNGNESLQLNQCAWPTALENIFPTSFRSNLLKLKSKQDITKAIKAHLDSLNIVPPSNKPFVLVDKAIQLVESQQIAEVEALAKACACSRRTLERAFKQQVGLSIKSYLQMMRLEQMVLDLHSTEKEVDWADFSQQYGFSDQSHLIRTLKQLVNKTPSGYLKKRDLTIDIYGDFED
ncbi:transcriptional regulator [Vibrio ishigakensis]|uniref:Transcriptional regulator n=1 Tax=Vibrio ishigakensis TaxID=1481914 RepID=A0A0B8QHL9_9VIBR|nr:transcriptional regulator [Vibrio ishigakensis]